jgi:hypothetical protein
MKVRGSVTKRAWGTQGGKLRAAGLAMLLLALGAACGGGGGGGPTAPPPTTASLSFTAAGSTSGSAVTLSRNGSGADTLVLDVQAQGVTGIYGVYFDLAFPSQVLAFDGATEGTFLSGGAGTSLQVASQTGNLVVGLTRLGAVGGISGSGNLLTLRFRAIGSGSGSIQFTRNQGVAADGDLIPDLDWLGGNVQVTR